MAAYVVGQKLLRLRPVRAHPLRDVKVVPEVWQLRGHASRLQKELAPATELLQKYGSEAFEKGMTAAAGAAKLAQDELAKANANAAKKE